jgi:hypothetical protein
VSALPSTDPPQGVARRSARGRRVGPATAGAAAGAALLAAALVYPHLPDPGALCPLRRITGIPCPGCGMTTGVVATVRGHVLDGFAANPVAPFLVLLAIAAVVWRGLALVSARDPGRGLAVALGRTVGRIHPFAVFPMVAALWLFELHRFGKL